MTKQSLIIVTPGFPKDEADTTCLPYIQMFIKALQKAYPDLQINVVSLQYPFFSKTYTWQTCKVISCGGKNKKTNRLITWYKAKQAIKSVIKTENVIGIVSMWLTECTYISQGIAAKNKIPLVAWSWGQDVKKENKYIKLLKFDAFSTAVISPTLQDLLFKNHSIKANHIINNGLDIDSIPQIKNGERDIAILCVGALNDFKRFDWIVDVVLAANNSAIKAVLVGEGPEEENIKKKIIEAGLTNQIQMLGKKEHYECLEIMNRAKILIHPSSFEGGPLVVLEALYYGCNVVSFTSPMNIMPSSFYKVATKEEMIDKVKFILDNNLGNKQEIVSTSSEAAKKIMNLFKKV